MGLLSVPLKTILPYHVDLQDEPIPETYAVCNGQTLTANQQDINPGSTYTLPDLRNVFLLGADIHKGAGVPGDTSVGSGGAPGPKGKGGQHSKSLVVAELAAHSHTGTIAASGGHTHTGSTSGNAGAHNHAASTTTAGAHTHAGSFTNITGAHGHAGSTMSNVGAHSHTVVDPGHTHQSWHNANINQPTNPPLGYGYGGVATLGSELNLSSATGISIAPNGDHMHTLSIAIDGAHSHSISLISDGSHTHPVTIENSGVHNHPITLVSDGNHTHSFTGDTTGSGQAWDTRPQFYGVVYIMKVQI